MSQTRRGFLGAAAAAPLAGGAAPPAHHSHPDPVRSDIDWTAFLARHDLVWRRPPKVWGEAAFLGNGRLAVSVLLAPDGRSLAFTVDNVDVFDRRDFSWGWAAYSRARYHVGDFHLSPVGRVTGAEMRLDLLKAELRGRLATDRGAIRFRALVHAERPLILVDLDTEGDEAGCSWNWAPTEAVSTRPPVRTPAQAAKYQADFGHPVRLWVDNPPGERRDDGELARWVQPLLAGGGYTTAWREIVDGRRRTLLISNAMSYPDLGSIEAAARAVREAATTPAAELSAAHRAWWERHYRASFLSLPDTRLESFYWIQIYKYGCIARPDAGVIDTHGPWLQKTNWPYLTWNLNVEISYPALQTGNRLALADGLFNSLDAHAETLRQNAGTAAQGRDVAALGQCSQQDLYAPLDADARYAREWGNLLWICQLYWRQYRLSLDEGRLRRLFPLLKRAVSLYFGLLQEGADGRLHLDVTYSPEIGVTRDCNYDLALLRWACSVLIEASARLRTEDPLLPRWRDIARRLTPYPTDETGYRIGADLAVSAHRHFSHLMMIYPLFLVTRDQPQTLPLIERSVDVWLDAAAKEGQASGFTLAVGSSFQSTLGRGDAALATLEGLTAGRRGIGQSFPNTMYAESGQNIETPLAVAQAVHDMLLQDFGGVIRLFPAVPSAWPDAVFHDLRAEGAFLVSARRRGGRIAWARVLSLAGEPCVVEADFGGPPACDRPLHRLGANRYAIALRRGESAVLRGAGAGELRIEPLPAEPGASNSYGLPEPA